MKNWLRRLAWFSGSIVGIYFANWLAALAFGHWAGPLASAAAGILGYTFVEAHWDA